MKLEGLPHGQLGQFQKQVGGQLKATLQVLVLFQNSVRVCVCFGVGGDAFNIAADELLLPQQHIIIIFNVVFFLEAPEVELFITGVTWGPAASVADLGVQQRVGPVQIIEIFCLMLILNKATILGPVFEDEFLELDSLAGLEGASRLRELRPINLAGDLGVLVFHGFGFYLVTDFDVVIVVSVYNLDR